MANAKSNQKILEVEDPSSYQGQIVGDYKFASNLNKKQFVKVMATLLSDDALSLVSLRILVNEGIEKVINIAKPASPDELEPLEQAIIEFRKAFKKETNKTIKDLDKKLKTKELKPKDVAEAQTSDDVAAGNDAALEFQSRIDILTTEAKQLENKQAAKNVALKLSEASTANRKQDSTQAEKLLSEAEDMLDAAEPLIDSTILKSLMKKSVTRAHPFAYGLSTSTGPVYTMAKPAKAPNSLARKIRKQTDAPKASFGMASFQGEGLSEDGDDDSFANATLVLKIAENSKALPGMLKQLKKWVRSAANPFRGKLKKVVLYNETGIEETLTSQEEAELAAEANANVASLETKWETAQDKISAKIQSLKDEVTPSDSAATQSLQDQAKLERLGKIETAWGQAKAKAANGDYKTAFKVTTAVTPALNALQQEGTLKDLQVANQADIPDVWEQAKALAQGYLTQTLDAMKKQKKTYPSMPNDLFDKALIEMRAVRAQINGVPDTLVKVTEMLEYLETDQVVLDVCKLAYDFSKPLIQAAHAIGTYLKAVPQS